MDRRYRGIGWRSEKNNNSTLKFPRRPSSWTRPSRPSEPWHPPRPGHHRKCRNAIETTATATTTTTTTTNDNNDCYYHYNYNSNNSHNSIVIMIMLIIMLIIVVLVLVLAVLARHRRCRKRRARRKTPGGPPFSSAPTLPPVEKAVAGPERREPQKGHAQKDNLSSHSKVTQRRPLSDFMVGSPFAVPLLRASERWSPRRARACSFSCFRPCWETDNYHVMR